MDRKDRRPPRSGGADRFGDRPERADRGPRLGDAAFRAQRDALEQAQGALRKLAAQAHGEALAQLMDAWKKRDASLLPAARDLGRTVSPSAHAAWAKALSGDVQQAAGDALLRLEIAADVPTPAEHHDARRALQLQMLTRRNDPSPQETWTQDAGRVLATAAEPGSERRLQGALKILLRK